MLIKGLKGWELPESLVTPEHMFLNRRRFMGATAGVAAFLTAGVARAEDDPSMGLYPAKLNPKLLMRDGLSLHWIPTAPITTTMNSARRSRFQRRLRLCLYGHGP